MQRSLEKAAPNFDGMWRCVINRETFFIVLIPIRRRSEYGAANGGGNYAGSQRRA
jgi:hypothetical protein